MSEELGNSPAPAESEAVERRLRAIEDVRALMGRETTGQGDNVKPLAELDPSTQRGQNPAPLLCFSPTLSIAFRMPQHGNAMQSWASRRPRPLIGRPV